MFKLLEFIFVLHISIYAGDIYAACPNGWQQYQDSCFVLKHENLTWNAAQALCQSMHARLAEVQTKGKVDFLKTMLAHSNADWWIGAKDDAEEGKWRWASGELFDYTDWAPHEPNNDHNQDCLQMWKSHRYFWDDDVCTVKKSYICEKNADGSSPVIG